MPSIFAIWCSIWSARVAFWAKALVARAMPAATAAAMAIAVAVKSRRLSSLTASGAWSRAHRDFPWLR